MHSSYTNVSYLGQQRHDKLIFIKKSASVSILLFTVSHTWMHQRGLKVGFFCVHDVELYVPPTFDSVKLIYV